MNDYERAKQLAVDAECHGIDLVDYVLAHAPELLACPDRAPPGTLFLFDEIQRRRQPASHRRHYKGKGNDRERLYPR